jgi:hypothetical protein
MRYQGAAHDWPPYLLDPAYKVAALRVLARMIEDAHGGNRRRGRPKGAPNKLRQPANAKEADRRRAQRARAAERDQRALMDLLRADAQPHAVRGGIEADPD